jgi:hypothetical protein
MVFLWANQGMNMAPPAAQGSTSHLQKITHSRQIQTCLTHVLLYRHRVFPSLDASFVLRFNTSPHAQHQR